MAERIVYLTSLLPYADEVAVPQARQVVGDAGLGHGRPGGNIVHRPLLVQQQPEDGQTAGVGQGVEELRLKVGFVKYGSLFFHGNPNISSSHDMSILKMVVVTGLKSLVLPF